jgi:hypothetical protein
MNIFTYILYLKNNIYKNKKFFLAISIFTIFFFTIYNFSIKKNYNLNIEVEFSLFNQKKNLFNNVNISTLRTINQYIVNFGIQDEIFYRPNSTVVYKTDQIDVLIYNIREEIKKKFSNISYVRVIKIPSGRIVYKFKTGGNSLTDIEEKKKIIFSEFKNINDLINNNTLSIINEIVSSKIDQEIYKEIYTDSLLMNLTGKSIDNQKNLYYQNFKKEISSLKNSLLLSQIDFINIEDSIIENTYDIDFYYSALISILIWAVTVLIGNILILEYQLSKKNNIKKIK